MSSYIICFGYQDLEGKINSSDGIVNISLQGKTHLEDVSISLNVMQSKILSEYLNSIAAKADVDGINKNHLFGDLTIDTND